MLNSFTTTLTKLPAMLSRIPAQVFSCEEWKGDYHNPKKVLFYKSSSKK